METHLLQQKPAGAGGETLPRSFNLPQRQRIVGVPQQRSFARSWLGAQQEGAWRAHTTDTTTRRIRVVFPLFWLDTTRGLRGRTVGYAQDCETVGTPSLSARSAFSRGGCAIRYAHTIIAQDKSPIETFRSVRKGKLGVTGDCSNARRTENPVRSLLVD